MARASMFTMVRLTSKGEEWDSLHGVMRTVYKHTVVIDNCAGLKPVEIESWGATPKDAQTFTDNYLCELIRFLTERPPWVKE